MVTNSIPSSHQNKWKHTAVVRGQWQLVGQHNTTQHTTGGLAWFQNSKPFFESNLVGNGQSYPDKNTHFQSGKLVWDAAFMWRESRHSSLVSLRLSLSRLGCCWYACRILIFQQRQQLWPLASLFFILAASPFAVLWRTDQTKQCPAQKSCCFSRSTLPPPFSAPIATPRTLCKLMCTKQCPDQKNTTGACCRLAAAAPHLCHNPQLQPPLQKQHHLFLHFQCSIGVHNTDTQTKMFRDHHIKTQIFFQATKFSSPRP